MRSSWDYLVIGSSGFAQVGKPDYWDKQEVEKNYLMRYVPLQVPCPADMEPITHLKWKSFEHEFGVYHELVLYYNRDLVEDWEYQYNEFIDGMGTIPEEQAMEYREKHERFWRYANALESVELDTEQVMIQCNEIYLGQAKHLGIVHVTHPEHPEYSQQAS